MLYRTERVTARGERFVGFTQDVKRSRALTRPHDFGRIALASYPKGGWGFERATVQAFPATNWLRRLARLFFTGARLRAILRRV